MGDSHGYHHNLRKFLVEQKVINKKGEAINRDEYRVYSTGDLIDGNINLQGDILNLEFASEWFDNICIGNHEYAFLGGRDFGTRRKHDRKTLKLLLSLMDDGLLTPSVAFDNWLLTHAGLSDEFDFNTAADANEFIHHMWEAAPDLNETIAIFDWKNNSDSHYGDPTSGIFNLSWSKKRNTNFNQVSGHTIHHVGPIRSVHDNDISHWNIDVGGKDGAAIGGIIFDDETKLTDPVFWGTRKTFKTTIYESNPVKYPLYGGAVTPRQLALPSGTGSTTNKYNPDTGERVNPLTRPLSLGDKLISVAGIVFRVSAINRVQDSYVLTPDMAQGPNIHKFKSESWESWRYYSPETKYSSIPLTDLRDINVLQDHEIMLHFKEYADEIGRE